MHMATTTDRKAGLPHRRNTLLKTKNNNKDQRQSYVVAHQRNVLPMTQQ